MKLLLDTHALLWWLSDDERLGPEARKAIADPDNHILVSVVSLWEIVVKVRVGKLTADLRDVSDAIEQQDFSVLAISLEHLLTLAGLAQVPAHRDPFDHLLIAQAMTAGATFLSQDGNAKRYPVIVQPCGV